MGVEALIDMERKGCESIIHDHDCDLYVSMAGWVDVPYSDRGDFRRRRAVAISSSPKSQISMGQLYTYNPIHWNDKGGDREK